MSLCVYMLYFILSLKFSVGQISAEDRKGETVQTLVDSCYLSSEPRIIDNYEPFYLIKNGYVSATTY
mgnify:CR=1 FL=1